MKILVATGIYPPDIGGPATYSKLLADRLPALGIEVSVLSFGSVRRLPKVFRHIAYFFKCLSALSGTKLVFAQDPVSVGLPALIAARILRKPFLIRVAGDYAWEQAAQRFGVSDSIDEFQNRKYGFRVEILRRVQRFVVRNADRVIVPSRYFKTLVARWIPDGENRVEVIYNGIEFQSIEAAGQEFEKRTIISAGRLVPWKGFDTLIEALVDLPEWMLEIAGEGPDRSRLEKMIAERGLGTRIKLLGELPRSELMKRIAHAEIFALPTRFESFSFQVVEAMFAGTPVVVTRVGSLPELVEDDREGILIAPDRPEELVAAACRFHTDRAFRELCVQNARTKSRQFDVSVTLAKLKETLSPFL